MKKRKPSDFIKDDIRKRRKEYVKKRNKETKIESDIRKKIHAQIPDGYSPYSDEDRMLSSKNYYKLKKTPCPEILCLDSNIEETISFLKRLPGAYIPSRNSGRRIKNYSTSKIKRYFDFASVKKICPASALIISSCYFMCKIRGGNMSINDWQDWDEGVKSTLAEMGFFELIGFDLIPTSKDSQEISVEDLRSGDKTNNESIAEHFQRLVQKLDEKDSMGKNNISFKQTLGAISEAAENSVRHAYTGDFPKDVRNRWWFGGMLSPNKKEITFVCYDKGISIPKHIKEMAIKEEKHYRIKTAIERWILKTGKGESDDNLDHKRLEFAMQYAKTSTGNVGGGKGLSHIVKIIEGFPGGEVKIISRRAHAVVTKGKAPVFTLLDTPIIGTLIIWKIRL